MDLQAKLKELHANLETYNKAHIDAKAAIIKTQKAIKELQKVIEKANEILNPSDSKKEE